MTSASPRLRFIEAVTRPPFVNEREVCSGTLEEEEEEEEEEEIHVN